MLIRTRTLSNRSKRKDIEKILLDAASQNNQIVFAALVTRDGHIVAASAPADAVSSEQHERFIRAVSRRSFFDLMQQAHAFQEHRIALNSDAFGHLDQALFLFDDWAVALKLIDGQDADDWDGALVVIVPKFEFRHSRVTYEMNDVVGRLRDAADPR